MKEPSVESFLISFNKVDGKLNLWPYNLQLYNSNTSTIFRLFIIHIYCNLQHGCVPLRLFPWSCPNPYRKRQGMDRLHLRRQDQSWHIPSSYIPYVWWRHKTVDAYILKCSSFPSVNISRFGQCNNHYIITGDNERGTSDRYYGWNLLIKADEFRV